MLLRAILFFVILAALAALLWLLPKQKKLRRFGIGLLTVSLLLELFVFNFHSYHLFLGGYDERELPLAEAKLEGQLTHREDGTLSSRGSGTVSLTFEGIGQRVGTVYLDLVLPDRERSEDGVLISPRTDRVSVTVDATDETQAAYPRYGVASGTAVFGDGRSQTLVINLSGEVDTLTLHLTGDGEFTLRGITLNRPVPLALSPLRLLLLVGGVLGLYLLLTSPALSEGCDRRRTLFGWSSAAITAAMVLAALAITMLCNYNTGGYLMQSLLQTGGNQITKELVDAFRAGQVSLLETPPEELLALENPYDWSERLEAGVSYLWDHLLYEGKYYSYYGIAPVLLLFLPYNLLTGYYFPSDLAIFLFGAAGILFLSLALGEVVRRYFPSIPVRLAISALLVLQLSSGILYCFVYPNFYEIAQASGFCFTTAGLWLLLRAGTVGGGRLSLLSLSLSSVCLSLAVLCRPTLAVYCVAALLFIGFGYRKRLLEVRSTGGSVKRESVGYFAAALLPFAVIGGVQVVYNILRFGNPLDFGIQYSLTINDFTRAEYHTDLAAIGFFNFLLAVPTVRPEFPFVFSNFSALGTNGYYFIANYNAAGLVFRALPVLGYLAAPAAWRELDRSHRLPAILTVGATAVLCPLVIIFSIWESGYGVRYMADFAWQLTMGGLLILFLLHERGKSDPTRVDLSRRMARFFALSAVVALAVNLALVFEYLPREGYLEGEYLRLARIFNFWK